VNSIPTGVSFLGPRKSVLCRIDCVGIKFWEMSMMAMMIN